MRKKKAVKFLVEFCSEVTCMLQLLCNMYVQAVISNKFIDKCLLNIVYKYVNQMDKSFVFIYNCRLCYTV